MELSHIIGRSDLVTLAMLLLYFYSISSQIAGCKNEKPKKQTGNYVSW